MHLKILSLGDECSVSAQRYLAKMAKCDDISVIAGNLTLDNNSLEAHFSAIRDNNADFRFEYNDEGSVRTTVFENFCFSKAMDWFDWDYVSVQQSILLSGDADSYFPFICSITDTVRQLNPRTGIIINEPWAFESDCIISEFQKYNNNTRTMAQKIREATIEAASRANIRIVLPVGEAWSEVRNADFCRLTGDDGCHASRCGEFLAGAVWYEILTGNDISKNKYRLPFVSAEITADLKKIAHAIAEKYKL